MAVHDPTSSLAVKLAEYVPTVVYVFTCGPWPISVPGVPPPKFQTHSRLTDPNPKAVLSLKVVGTLIAGLGGETLKLV